MSDFTARVLSVVRRIPVGRVATYGDVAAVAGKPRASRAVGNIMRNCGGRDVPAHRVVAAAGRLGGYGGNLELKRALLRAEGLTVTRTTIRDFRERRWGPRASGRARKSKGDTQIGGPGPSERQIRRVEGPGPNERRDTQIEGPGPSERRDTRVEGPGPSERQIRRVEGNVNPAWLRLR